MNYTQQSEYLNDEGLDRNMTMEEPISMVIDKIEKHIVAGYSDGVIRIFKPSLLNPSKENDAVNKNENLQNQNIKSCNSSFGQLLNEFTFHNYSVEKILSKDEETFISCDINGNLVIWSFKNNDGNIILKKKLFSGYLNDICGYSELNKYFLYIGYTGSQLYTDNNNFNSNSGKNNEFFEGNLIKIEFDSMNLSECLKLENFEKIHDFSISSMTCNTKKLITCGELESKVRVFLNEGLLLNDEISKKGVKNDVYNSSLEKEEFIEKGGKYDGICDEFQPEIVSITQNNNDGLFDEDFLAVGYNCGYLSIFSVNNSGILNKISEFVLNGEIGHLAWDKIGISLNISYLGSSDFKKKFATIIRDDTGKFINISHE